MKINRGGPFASLRVAAVVPKRSGRWPCSFATATNYLIYACVVCSLTFSGAPLEAIAKKTHFRVLMTGDVMLGRGIDQILSTPSKPGIYESYIKDSRDYLQLAIKKNGSIPLKVADDYIWGYAKKVIAKEGPELTIVNLETAITTSDDFWPNKGIHYRLHPENTRVIKALGIDICTLANNHSLDWGYRGLKESIESLRSNKIYPLGAGDTRTDAEKPYIKKISNSQRLLVFAFGSPSSGVYPSWAASSKQAGLAYLRFSPRDLSRVKDLVRSHRKKDDIVILSLHWGPNWGYNIAAKHQNFAHRLIDEGLVNLVFGHSSHHPKGVEFYRNVPIIYGAGDLINDYEGINSRRTAKYRGHIGGMYLLNFALNSKNVDAVIFYPSTVKKFRVEAVNSDDFAWISKKLQQESARLNTTVTSTDRRILLKAAGP